MASLSIWVAGIRWWKLETKKLLFRRNILLINEVLEAKDYIAGKNINKNNLYRTVYLMAKYHIMQGVPIPDIRQKIFDWGRENNVWIKYSVNDITIRAAEDKRQLLCPESVNVSDEDV